MARLSIKVVPGSSRDEVAGWLGEELKIRVSAPPEDGKANKAVISLLAAALEVPEKHITIVSGHGSSRKTIEVGQLELSDMMARLKRYE